MYRNHYADLLETIKNPTQLSKRLHSAGLLSCETKKRICDLMILRQQKVAELLEAIETKIISDSQSLYKFVEELETDNSSDNSASMKELCHKLRSTRGGECAFCVKITTYYDHNCLYTVEVSVPSQSVSSFPSTSTSK